MTDYGEFRFPADAEGVRNALGNVDAPYLDHLLRMMADRDHALEHFIDGRNIPIDAQDVGAGWIVATTNHDLFSFTVNAKDGNPFPFATIQQPMLTLSCNPGDAVAWDATLQLRTATAGGGTLLGSVNQRNPGTFARYTAVLIGDEWVVAPNVAQTYTVRVLYSTAVPTTGLDTSGLGDNRARTRIRRDMSTF